MPNISNTDGTSGVDPPDGTVTDQPFTDGGVAASATRDGTGEPDDAERGVWGDDAVASDDAGPVFRASGIEKSYGSRLPLVGEPVSVLAGADLTLWPGEIVGIVGANGSGKSTLLQILVGTLEPDAGQVATAGRVGWCPQESLLYDRLTVAETFRLFGEAYGMDADRVRERRDTLAERLDFERFLDYRVAALSGGNRRKVNLAVAVLHDPDVLLLDEPYTGFDWETYLAFWELTEDLVADGTAVAIVSHLVSERERFDRVLELRDGELHERDDPGRQPRTAAHDTADDGSPGHDDAAAPVDRPETGTAEPPDRTTTDTRTTTRGDES
ncbi:ABC transporter ATP-binding protein [Halobaculum sp. MBLA0147]|uniref:ABC transporter ATP-binding protein n=1 Tax=Halobaculum sp. MBLA0147 TaxID=3079934 RepID=UPI00352600B3